MLKDAVAPAQAGAQFGSPQNLDPGLRRGDERACRELRALALLLDYPTEQSQAHMREIAAALQPGTRKEAHALLTALAMDELITLQEQYLDTFDRGRRTALNLFEHVHGDSRDRGQAMVDLLTMYEGAGMHYAGDQLPDYLPVFLDFVATLPAAQARAQLGEVVHILQSIAAALARRESVYLPALTALLQLAGAADCSTKSSSTELCSAEDENTEDDTSLGAIDAAYAEAPVNFLDARLQAAGNGCAPQTRPALQPIRIHRRVA